MAKTSRKPRAKQGSGDLTAIDRAVKRYAQGLREGNPDMLREVFVPDAFVCGYEGDTPFTPAHLGDLCEFASKNPSRAFKPRIGPPKMQGKTATVVVHEPKYVGFNYVTNLQLIKTRKWDNQEFSAEKWLIMSKLFHGTKAR